MMESPLVRVSTRTSLTRHRTSDDQSARVYPRKRAIDSDSEPSLPGHLLNPKVRSDTIKSDDIESNVKREHGTMSPWVREVAELRRFERLRAPGQNGDKDNLDQLRKLDFNLEVIDEKSFYEPSI